MKKITEKQKDTIRNKIAKYIQEKVRNGHYSNFFELIVNQIKKQDTW